MSAGNDIRFHRAHGFKPTIQTPAGVTWTVALRIYRGSTIDNATRQIVGGTLIASASCGGITVLP